MTSKGIALILIGALALGCVGFYYFYIKPRGEVPPTTTQPPTTEAPSPTAKPPKKSKPPKSPEPTPQPTPQPTQPPTVDFASFWRSLQPGVWARYEITSPQGPMMYMTVTVQGRETKRGVECIKVTYEYEVSGQAGGATTATAWISIETGETVEVEVCLPGMGCQSATPGQYQYTPTTTTSTIIGTETISVPAGTFTCYKISTPGGTFWWSTDAPPLGLVKATITTGGEMVLVALGS